MCRVTLLHSGAIWYTMVCFLRRLCCTCPHEAVSEQADCSIVVLRVALWLYLLHSGAVCFLARNLYFTSSYCLHSGAVCITVAL